MHRMGLHRMTTSGHSPTAPVLCGCRLLALPPCSPSARPHYQHKPQSSALFVVPYLAIDAPAS